MNQFYTGVGLVFLSAMGFGMIPIFALYAYQGGATVNTLLFLRFIIAAVFFLTYTFIKYRNFELKKIKWGSLLLMGGILYMLQSVCYFSAVKYIPASLAVLLFYTYPVFVAVLSAIIDKEILTKQVIFAILVSSAGLVMVLGTTFKKIDAFGVLLAAAAGLVYSCYITMGNRVVKQLPVMVTSAFVTLFASFSFLVIGLATDSLTFHLPLPAWLAVAGLALFSTIIAIFTFFRGIELIGSTRASILSMVEPLTTIGFSAMLFGERMSWLQLVGGIAVLGGAVSVVTAVRQDRHKDTTVQPVDNSQHI
ncbi:DMT family transporter [Desulfotruncus alcoholivorax]|uniref:DMT family transporter n=1 Tax=Desulfotruncus alcoholivorax TaxID=265477 RepID=UPI00040182E4|nr:EamA family transporter [Desulfotruncus alcoholivorax]